MPLEFPADNFNQQTPNPMDHIIIGIVGEIATGKSTASEYIKQTYGAVSFRFSDMLRDIVARMHVEPTRANMQLLSTILRQNFGEDLLSRALAAEVSASNHSIIITEGVRRLSDVTHLQNVPGFHLIAIDTDPKTRFERLKNRHENPDDSTKTWEQFVAEGSQESEAQVRDAMNKAEAAISNNGTLPELYLALDTLLHTYGATRTR